MRYKSTRLIRMLVSLCNTLEKVPDEVREGTAASCPASRAPAAPHVHCGRSKLTRRPATAPAAAPPLHQADLPPPHPRGLRAAQLRARRRPRGGLLYAQALQHVSPACPWDALPVPGAFQPTQAAPFSLLPFVTFNFSFARLPLLAPYPLARPAGWRAAWRRATTPSRCG